jgi:hypothetical protein
MCELNFSSTVHGSNPVLRNSWTLLIRAHLVKRSVAAKEIREAANHLRRFHYVII